MKNNKYLEKVAKMSDTTKNSLKTFGKLTAIGLATKGIGAAVGGPIGARLAKTGFGKAVGSKAGTILKSVNSATEKMTGGLAKSKLSVPSGAVAGAVIGAEGASWGSEYAALHHDIARQSAEQHQQDRNKYLAKAANYIGVK